MSTDRFMMATKAIHKLGDISRDEPDLCIIYSEDTDNYIGNWVTGFGFVEVKFPKDTTRKLTKKEEDHYHGMPVSIGDSVSVINITGEKFDKPIRLFKGDMEVFQGILKSPIKVGGVIFAINPTTGRYYKTSSIKKIGKDTIKTNNSTYKIVYE